MAFAEEENVNGTLLTMKKLLATSDRGGSRIFSRGADFQNFFENFDFFRLTNVVVVSRPPKIEDVITYYYYC